MTKQITSTCPCGRDKSLSACCAPFHGGEPAPDAESLMRSRYSAYVLGLEAYLLATWHPSSRPPALNLAEEAPVKWIGLDVKRKESQDDTHATVSFVARYKVGGKAHRLEETSRFVKDDGRWFYVDGDVKE